MIDLDALHGLLTRANVTDDVLSRGVRLKRVGLQKLASSFGVSEDEVKEALKQLSQKVRDEMPPMGLPTLEGVSRYAYEADSLGNVMLRDIETGAERFLSGQEAQLLLSEIERLHPNYESLIRPYFDSETLREFVEDDVMGVEDNGNTGGTYNFPFKGMFACARFWLQGTKPMIKVISLVDADGEDVHMDSAMEAAATKAAWDVVGEV